MKKVAIIQSNYIPWRGYFDIIGYVDEFIIYDDMQYTKRDWRNRNKVKTNNGLKWISIPVKVKGKYFQKIRETEVSTQSWGSSHWKTIEHSYSKADFFSEISEKLKPLYERRYKTISDINESFIRAICDYLNIETLITHSWDYDLHEGKSERLASLVNQAKGTCYVSGPAARSYLDCNIFNQNNLEIEWFDISKYKPYSQLWGEYEGEASVIDLLFNHGKDAKNYMHYTRQK